VVAGDRARQVAREGSADEADVPEGVARGLQERASELQTQVEARIQQCQKIQQERQDFETLVSETIAWLEQKEDQLASCGPQEIAAERVMQSLNRHQVKHLPCVSCAVSSCPTVSGKCHVSCAWCKFVLRFVARFISRDISVRHMPDDIRETFSYRFCPVPCFSHAVYCAFQD